MIESFRKRRWSIPALALVILVGTAIVIGVSNRAAEPNGAAPAGALGGFLSQTDGKFGYGMLRPAGWTSHDGSFARFYSDIPDGTRARLLLIAYNVGLAGSANRDPNGIVLEWDSFRRNPTLQGWTSDLERSWRHDQMPFALLETLPDAKVYRRAVLPDGTSASLVACAVDGGKPLIVGLSGGAAQPAFEPLDRLRADGVLADFVSMVRSLHAIPADPANVSPSLP
jgi:hypothetical protein